jgi:hypothetical protein
MRMGEERKIEQQQQQHQLFLESADWLADQL